MIRWNRKTLLAKIETTYGVDPTPTAAANAILATNITLRPMEGEDVDRNLERPYHGASAKIPVGLYSMLTFDVELVGSGTVGEAPGWGPLLRMVSVAETVTEDVSVVYTPITDAPESAAVWIYIEDVQHKFAGSRANAVFALNAQGIPVMRYSVTGLFTQPATVTAALPDLSAFQKPQAVTKANTPSATIGGTAFVTRSFELDLGRQVERRLLIGKEEVIIADAKESLKMTVEAVPLATYDPFITARNQVEKAIQLVHGTVAGKIVTLDIPKAQQRRPSGYENQQNVVEWPLEFDPLPDEGDDQWSLTLT